MNFEHDYLVFDELGIKQVGCMACGNAIKTRKQIPSDLSNGKVVWDLAKHADYREIPVVLSDMKISFLMICDSCRFVDIGKKEADLITGQLQRAKYQELEFEGKDKLIIDVLMEPWNKRFIMRKAEPIDIEEMMRGVI
jgi:hypothetical protein